MAHNQDFRKELPKGHEVKYLKKRNCPKCNNRLVALPPDRVWCVDSKCNYGEMHLIGNGVQGLELELTGEIIGFQAGYPIKEEV